MTDHQSQNPQGPGEGPPPGGYPPPHQGQHGAGAPPPQGQPGGMAQQPPIQDAGLQPPVANLLSYLFGFIGGLIVFLTQRDREVRFHAAQSILLSIFFVVTIIAVQILVFVLAIADPTGVISLIFGLLAFLLFLAIPVIAIIMCIMGYQQKHVKLPIIGGIAEGWAAGGATV